MSSVSRVGLVSNMLEAYEGVFPRGGKTPVSLQGFEKHEDFHTPVEFVVIGSVHEENTRYVERAAKFIKDGAKLVYCEISSIFLIIWI
jgi:hypothetical protein